MVIMTFEGELNQQGLLFEILGNRLRAENHWQRYYYSHLTPTHRPTQEEFIKSILEGAKKEIFSNIKLVKSDKFHGLVIKDDEKMIQDLKKWLGGAAENKKEV
jgi:ferritin-like protein